MMATQSSRDMESIGKHQQTYKGWKHRHIVRNVILDTLLCKESISKEKHQLAIEELYTLKEVKIRKHGHRKGKRHI